MSPATESSSVLGRARRPRALALVFAILMLAALACSLPGKPQPAPSQGAPPPAGGTTQRTVGTTSAVAPTEAMPGGKIAFFFQTVGQFNGGVGANTVRIATTCDMQKVEACPLDALSWSVRGTSNDYGDPVFSRLDDGTWTMTAWRMSNNTQGGRSMMLYQGSCPFVQDDGLVSLGVSRGPSCASVPAPLDGKTSQVFQIGGEGYVLLSIQSDIHIAHITSAGHSVRELDGLCVGQSPIKDVSKLAFGATAPIIRKADTGGMLLSDTALGRREDGTWVLFVKGIEPNQKCERDSICELCARNIYRTTSKDLVDWSDFELMVKQASVPEAVTTGDGTIWLYWQDFAKSCAAGDARLGAVSPVSGAYEQAGSHKLSDPIEVHFAGDSDWNDPSSHSPTNGNPIYLPDAAAVAALDACVASGGGGTLSAPVQGPPTMQAGGQTAGQTGKAPGAHGTRGQGAGRPGKASGGGSKASGGGSKASGGGTKATGGGTKAPKGGKRPGGGGIKPSGQ